MSQYSSEASAGGQTADPSITFDGDGHVKASSIEVDSAHVAGKLTVDTLAVETIEVPAIDEALSRMDTLYDLITNSQAFGEILTREEQNEANLDQAIAMVQPDDVKSADADHVASDGLEVLGDETQASSGPITQPFLVDAIATFLQNIVIRGNAIIEGTLRVSRIIFGNDTAGVAVIPKWSKKVRVEFDDPYDKPPRVTISLVIPDSSDDSFLSEGAQAAVADVTETGFTILIDEPAPREFEYTWVAVAVDDIKRTVGTEIEEIPVDTEEHEESTSSSEIQELQEELDALLEQAQAEEQVSSESAELVVTPLPAQAGTPVPEPTLPDTPLDLPDDAFTVEPSSEPEAEPTLEEVIEEEFLTE